MAFLRRKSGVYHDDIYQEDHDQAKGRRRLSKPLTNTSSSNLQSSATQPYHANQPFVRRKSLSKSATTDSLPYSSPNESREALRSHLFDPSSDFDPKNLVPNPSAVTSIVSKYENHGVDASSSSQSLALPTTSKRPLSNLLNSWRPSETQASSISSVSSRERLGLNASGPVSAQSSLERIVEDPAPPSRRTASFAPGSATRKASSPQKAAQEETDPVFNIVVENAEDAPGVLHQTLAEEAWTPPPQDVRSSTPSDLDYTHLGGLSLGTLHVVNGRASPAPSELSKFFQSQSAARLRRDVSSVYESELGTVKAKRVNDIERKDAERYAGPMAGMRRQFSFMPGTEARFNHAEVYQGFDQEESLLPQSTPIKDHTAKMAEEYMAELPTSPYGNSGTAVLEGPVRQHEGRLNGQRSFVGEPLAAKSTTDRLDSPLSFFSVPEPEATNEDRFMSAVELQSTRSQPASPERSPVRNTQKLLLPVPQPSLTESDSGYSSSNSLHAISPSIEKRSFEIQPDILPRDTKHGSRFPFRKPKDKTGKGVLVMPVLSTNIPSPSSAKVEQISSPSSATALHPRVEKIKTSTTSQPISPTNSDEKLRKKLVKQRRKSTADTAKDLVVQRIASIECFSVPPITNRARSSLAVRSEALPELERTYRSEDTATPVNVSVLSFTPVVQDVRFPSPEPEKKESVRRSLSRSLSRSNSRSRSRSRGRPSTDHRPKSWFGWPKGDKQDQKRNADDYAPPVNLHDLGSVVDVLGNNPYDIARVKTPLRTQQPDLPRSRTCPSPFEITTIPRPRSTMDDRTASQTSRPRSRSNSVREDNQRHSFDDRGGVPGKIPHSARLSIDAPPLPPMPTTEEINKRLSYRHGFATHFRPLHYQAVPSSDPASVDEPDEPPPPPPHSPRRVYVEDVKHQEQPTELQEPNQPEEVPPPPPCHSPRPIDVTPEIEAPREDVWASQANVWRARRQSAGEALRRTWEVEQIEQNQPTQREPQPHTIPRKPLRSWTQPDPNWHPQEYAVYDDYTHDPDVQNYAVPESYSHDLQYDLQYAPQIPSYQQQNRYDQYSHPQSDAYYYNAEPSYSHHSQPQFHRDQYTDYPQPRPRSHSRPRSSSRSRSRSRPRSQHSSHPPRPLAHEFYPAEPQHYATQAENHYHSRYAGPMQPTYNNRHPHSFTEPITTDMRPINAWRDDNAPRRKSWRGDMEYNGMEMGFRGGPPPPNTRMAPPQMRNTYTGNNRMLYA